jgi:hypothetical protein
MITVRVLLMILAILCFLMSAIPVHPPRGENMNMMGWGSRCGL